FVFCAPDARGRQARSPASSLAREGGEWLCNAGSAPLCGAVRRAEGATSGTKNKQARNPARQSGEGQAMRNPEEDTRIQTDPSDAVPDQARAQSEAFAAEYDSLRARLASNPVRERPDGGLRSAGASDRELSPYAPVRPCSVSGPDESRAHGGAEPPYAAAA